MRERAENFPHTTGMLRLLARIEKIDPDYGTAAGPLPGEWEVTYDHPICGVLTQIVTATGSFLRFAR